MSRGQRGVRGERFQLRAEDQRAVGEPGVVERLHAEAVAREEERLAVAVPESEGEHAAEAFHAALAPCLPRVDDHLGVALRPENVSERHELGDQLLEVVDLAVEDDDDGAVLVVERLLAGREIDDRESPMAEADSRFDVQPAPVRAAMVLGLVHAIEKRAVDLALAGEIEDADDAAHGYSPSRNGGCRTR